MIKIINGIVFKNLKSTTIKGNVKHNKAAKELMADQGDHNDGVIIKDNLVH